jgi:hypothetical protein
MNRRFVLSAASPIVMGVALLFTTRLPAKAKDGEPVLPTNPASSAPAARPAPSQSPSRPAHYDEFAEMDINGDGRISPEEYASSPREALDRIAEGKRGGPMGATGGFDLHNNEGNPNRSKFFRRLDANHDGFLSRSELGMSVGSAESGKH